jgi:hypothetical protein
MIVESLCPFSASGTDPPRPAGIEAGGPINMDLLDQAAIMVDFNATVHGQELIHPLPKQSIGNWTVPFAVKPIAPLSLVSELGDIQTIGLQVLNDWLAHLVLFNCVAAIPLVPNTPAQC